MERAKTMPSDVGGTVGPFDRFATSASRITGRATFFAFCLALVVLWAPTFFLLRSVDTWQLIINTITTIITFLLVALLQNTQTRNDAAIQHKLNALADGLADLMAYVSQSGHDRDLDRDLVELRRAVGLETHESSGSK